MIKRLVTGGPRSGKTFRLKEDAEIHELLQQLKTQHEYDASSMEQAYRRLTALDARNKDLEKLKDLVYDAQHAKVWSPEASQGSHDAHIQSQLAKLGKRVS